VRPISWPSTYQITEPAHTTSQLSTGHQHSYCCVAFPYPAAESPTMLRTPPGGGRRPAGQRGGAGAAFKTQTTGMAPDGPPMHSFRTLLTDPGTMARNTISAAIDPLYPLATVTLPTPVQLKGL
jgi:hypothetical protein